MLKVLDSRYKIPSRKTFTNTLLPDLYNKEVTCLRKSLEECLYYGCTCDFWSSTTTDPYLGVTVQYIDTNWDFQSKCLQCAFTPERHVAENVQQAITEALENWDLPIARMSAMTTDNGSNMIKACRLMDIPRMHCFGHCLHLAISGALGDDRITRLVGKCRKISSYFTQSFQRKTKLEAAQRKLGLALKCMVTDCETRWNAKYHLLDRILTQEPAIRRVISEDSQGSGATSHIY